MRTDRAPLPDERGFTLVELLIVVVILGALASTVVVASAGFRDKGAGASCIGARDAYLTGFEAFRSDSIEGYYPTGDAQVVPKYVRRSGGSSVTASGTPEVAVVQGKGWTFTITYGPAVPGVPGGSDAVPVLGAFSPAICTDVAGPAGTGAPTSTASATTVAAATSTTSTSTTSTSTSTTTTSTTVASGSTIVMGSGVQWQADSGWVFFSGSTAVASAVNDAVATGRQVTLTVSSFTSRYGPTSTQVIVVPARGPLQSWEYTAGSSTVGFNRSQPGYLTVGGTGGTLTVTLG